MYTIQQALTLMKRELLTQRRLSLAGSGEVLNIPLLLGPVGSAKTAISEIASGEFSLDLRTTNCGENSDVTDVAGLPVPSMVRTLLEDGTDAEKTEAGMKYMEWVLNRHAAEACVRPVGLFFDDFDKAPPPVQGACLAISGKRRFRDKPLHAETLIMAAGNRVTDDAYANQISESIRTRMTIIEVEPDIKSFTEWAVRTNRIHPIVLGFLQFKPELMHRWMDAVNRFPTLRGWKEVSEQFKDYPEPHDDVLGNRRNNNWQVIVAVKCGDAVANDFWAWYQILSKIDIKKVLLTGDLGVDVSDSERRAKQYAMVFAIAQELNSRGVKPEYKGLEILLRQEDSGLGAEMRVAFLVQLSTKTRQAISVALPKVADTLLEGIIYLEQAKPEGTEAKTS